MKKRYLVEIEIDSDEIDVSGIILNKFKFDFGCRIIDIKNIKETITTQQMKALHLYFRLLADEFNNKHFDMRAIIRQDVEIEWTPYTVKEYLFKPLIKVKYGKTSVKQLLKNKEIDSVVDILTKLIAERTDGQCDYVPFPSWENL